MASKNSSSAEDLRHRLILEAERLIALQGFAATAVRQVNAAAGTANTSAIYYHFGSREGLVAAILEHRFRQVNPVRLSQIAALRAGGSDSARDWLAAMIRPLAMQLAPRPEGNHYLRFLHRVILEAREPLQYDQMLTEGWRLIEDMLLGRLGDSLPGLAEHRLALVRTMAIAAMAAIEAEAPEPSIAAIRVEVLIDALAAMVGAPPTADAVAALRT